MRTRGRVYQEPRLTESERSQIEYCPRRCGNFVSEERQRGANSLFADVLFCINDSCAWREWAVVDISFEVERLASTGVRAPDIAAQLGLSERTVFRRLSRRVAEGD